MMMIHVDEWRLKYVTSGIRGEEIVRVRYNKFL